MRHPIRHRGYTLLLTLLLLSVMAASVAALARASLEAALEARDEEDELRRRWAVLSAQQVLAELGPRVLARQFAEHVASQDPNQANASFYAAPPSMLRETLTLGGLVIEIVFADEQARFNVNRTLVDAHGDAQTAQRRLSDGLERHLPNLLDRRTIALRPLDEDLAYSLDLPRLPSPGSVFELTGPDRASAFASGTEADAGWHGHLTVWGDGKLRLGLAGEPALRLLCEPMLEPDEIESLLAYRREAPAITVSDLLRWLPLRAAQRAWLRQRLTDTSSTFSLHMTIRDGPRRWNRLAIIEMDGTAPTVRCAMEWRP